MSFDTLMVGIMVEAVTTVGFLGLGYAIGAKGTDEIKKECESADKNKIIDELVATLEGMKGEN